jgi:hypothetical protein
MPLDDGEYEKLAAEYLKRLAQRDMRMWRARTMGQAALEGRHERMPYESARQIARMKRVLHLWPARFWCSQGYNRTSTSVYGGYGGDQGPE